MGAKDPAPVEEEQELKVIFSSCYSYYYFENNTKDLKLSLFDQFKKIYIQGPTGNAPFEMQIHSKMHKFE